MAKKKTNNMKKDKLSAGANVPLPDVSTRFYEFGGMRKGQNTKLHIADDYGVALCGVKSFWMEAGQEIDKDGYLEYEKHLEPIYEIEVTCKRCLKKWLKNVC